MDGVTVIDHPLVQHKLTIMRRKETSTGSFRRLLREISTLLCYEVTRDLELTMETIETPLQTMGRRSSRARSWSSPRSCAPATDCSKACSISCLPRVSHIGVYRDHETLQPVEYYFKAPEDVAERLIIVVDPMLATGNSSIAAIDKLKERGAHNIRFLCLLAAPEGIRNFRAAHPDVRFSPHRSTVISTRRATSCRPRRCRRSHVRHQVISAFLYQIKDFTARWFAPGLCRRY
ncbi:uracil phosphoribosyltransferase [Rhizobium beringeri]